jgi:hypothetical protein
MVNQNLAEADGVEPSRRYSRSTVFKTGAIASWLALPLFGPSHNKQCSILVPSKCYTYIIQYRAIVVGPAGISWTYRFSQPVLDQQQTIDPIKLIGIVQGPRNLGMIRECVPIH